MKTKPLRFRPKMENMIEERESHPRMASFMATVLQWGAGLHVPILASSLIFSVQTWIGC